MSIPESQRSQLAQDALEAHKEDYRELSETWRALDYKAQGTVAISGIFLAAMLAFVRASVEEPSTLQQVLLTLTAILLTGSIVFSLLCLKIRSVSAPPVGESAAGLVNDLLQADDGATSERMLDYYLDQAKMWQTSNRNVRKATEDKARHAMTAQWVLFGAIAVSTVVVLLEVWV